jgi:hypothetical protein
MRLEKQGAGSSGTAITDTESKDNKTDKYETSDPVSTQPSSAPSIVTMESVKSTEQISSDQPINAGADHLNFNSQRDQGYYANQMNPVLTNQRVTGKVISQSGETLIGTLISIPNTNLVTSTDLFGKFELYLPVPTSPVEIVNTGYQDTTLMVSQGQEDLVMF